MGINEIREAVKAVSGVKRIIPGQNKFEPIKKRGYIIRPFDHDDEELLKRLEAFKNKEGVKFFFYEEGRYRTKTRVRVKSKAELRIANALTELGIRYFYEPIIDYGKYFSFPDFYLPDFELVYEHFGMDEDESYQKVMERKKRLYARKGIKWIYTTSIDEAIITDVLKEKLNIR